MIVSHETHLSILCQFGSFILFVSLILVFHGGTLVICPATVIYQWKNEVETHVKPNTLSVYLHHGIKRETRAKLMSRADMVITTYGLVASEAKELVRFN